MSGLLHPSDETLARFAAGNLGPGPSRVVAAHLENCSQCRLVVGRFEAVGGALLEELPASPLAPDGLARALAAIEPGSTRAAKPAAAGATRARPKLPAGLELPASLRDCDFGRWRWIAPGIRVSRATGAGARGGDLKLFRLAPGTKMPRHGHYGTEWTCVLSGSFDDGRARFRAGDIAEVDHDIDHQPIVDKDAECICLVAMEGRMKHHGIIGRLHQMIFDA